MSKRTAAQDTIRIAVTTIYTEKHIVAVPLPVVAHAPDKERRMVSVWIG